MPAVTRATICFYMTLPATPYRRCSRRLLVIAVATLLAAACGGGESPSPPDSGTPPPTDTVQIRGNERLAWVQSASSVQDLRTHTYRLYIDGTAAAMSEVQCSESGVPAGYECSGRLPAMAPGRHVLELASVRNGVESPRSAPLAVTRLTSLISGTAPSHAGNVSPNGQPVIKCAAGATECGDVRVISTDMGVVSVLGATPDGRLFLIEDERRVRVVERDTLADEPALAIDSSSARLVGLAVDSAFEETRTVFIAWAVASPDGRSELNITRYRELQNRFGEGATIVAGLPLAGTGPVPLAVDDHGLIYAAMPGPADPEAASASPYDAAILRFTGDGLTPDSNRGASPVLSNGYVRPAALVVDAAHRRVWLAGDDGTGSHSLSSISLDANTHDEWRQQAERYAGQASHLTIAAPSAQASDLLIGWNGDVRRGLFRDDGRLRGLEAVARLEIDRPILATTGGVDARLFVAGTTFDGTTVLLRMSARP